MVQNLANFSTNGESFSSAARSNTTNKKRLLSSKVNNSDSSQLSYAKSVNLNAGNDMDS